MLASTRHIQTPLKGLGEFFFVNLSLQLVQWVSHHFFLGLFNLLSGREKIYIPLKITSMKYIFKMYRQYRTPHHENRALAQHAGLHLIVGCCRSALAFIGCRWLLWALLWACVGLRWLLWACIGLCWLLWACIGLRWLLWACVGLRWLLWAGVGLHWPSLAAVGHCCGRL